MVERTCARITGSSSICERVTAAATKNVPASIRSGMALCAHPPSAATCAPASPRRREPALAPSPTPRTVIVSVPAPRMSAPAALSMAARSATSGSAAAPRMTVVPSASAAAVISECVAPTEGK